ncbi:MULTISPECIES: RidA family protein [unclassified Mesorhizobium]|uniref:RidA family protein n=1 Tax=unclassified Mesorhizobium TaxID=325217 RepID=UPI00112CD8A1|nr:MULTISPECIES: RidA family protein [unclassified Mesorhizobium]TPK67302.1 RidA family protein [Mesorhizobium sp. B2-5-1]TPM61898.1 RidA family protein [Mesorhizobium sp. B2-1-9]TPM82535.1 RidA family protein [Mesorhizobium sp. B2-1-4]TPN13233.1 RidA family protein [Mesorhizobium sp. B2-1-2]UCI11160.1 RidA family protein [Mesorhizobium sp. B2-1-1]
MGNIERFDKNERLSRIVVRNGTAYLSGLTADDKKTGTSDQTKEILEKADRLLASVGSDRSKLLFAQIWLRDVEDLDAMNKAWVTWLDGVEPPARATVGASFALPEIRVEIQLTAAI